MSVTLRQRILAERQAQDEQHALDRFAVSDDLADGIVSSIEALEDDEDQYRGSIEPWLVDALQLSRSYPSPTNRDVFSLRFDSPTLVPRDPWQKEFGLEGSRLLTWKRRIALDRPGVHLLRPGSKLLDACDRFMRWDDRGTTFLTWRVDPTSPDADLPWLAFRVCVSIQPRLPQGREIFARADAMGAWRRAQQFLAKSYHVVHVDADGEVISDPRRLEILRPVQFELCGLSSKAWRKSIRDSSYLPIKRYVKALPVKAEAILSSNSMAVLKSVNASSYFLTRR